MKRKYKAARNFIVLKSSVLEITQKIDVDELYLAMYKSLLKNGTVKNYDEFLSYCFVHQKEIGEFIYPLCFENL